MARMSADGARRRAWAMAWASSGAPVVGAYACQKAGSRASAAEMSLLRPRSNRGMETVPASGARTLNCGMGAPSPSRARYRARPSSGSRWPARQAATDTVAGVQRMAAGSPSIRRQASAVAIRARNALACPSVSVPEGSCSSSAVRAEASGGTSGREASGQPAMLSRKKTTGRCGALSGTWPMKGTGIPEASCSSPRTISGPARAARQGREARPVPQVRQASAISRSGARARCSL